MTLSQLRYAITVADSRSMNQAAQKLFISQPSLSAAIRELGDEVGDFPENQPRDPGDTGRRRICRICQTGRGTVCPDRGTVCG